MLLFISDEEKSMRK